MNVVISNIKFPRASNSINVPVSIESVKEWLDDYNIAYTDDQEALIIYMRTALFMECDPTYDIEYTEHCRIEHAEQKYCVDAFDHNHIAYITVAVIVDVPEVFHLYINDEELAEFKKYAGDDEQYIQTAIYDKLRDHLPVTINVIEPSDNKERLDKYTVEQLQYRLLSAFRDKLDQVLDSMKDMAAGTSVNEATRYVESTINELYAL